MLKSTIHTPLTQGQTTDWARKNYSYSEGLTLADDNTDLENIEVHIMLGADFLWLIMTGEIQQGKDENEPVAISTHFGYVPSGPVSNICHQHCYLGQICLVLMYCACRLPSLKHWLFSIIKKAQIREN